ncbi:MAG: hypothetical protein IIZ97_01660 [Prevotella sp.]|nr:hypothetical protein [Prevotella sp.]
MEEQTTTRIIEIEVDTDNAIQSLRELGEQVAKNKTRLDELKKEGKENSDEFIKLANENKVLTQQMRQTEKQIQNNIKQQKAQEDSLVQLRAKLANLNKQYDEMSGFDRLGVKGQELQRTIKGLSDQISGLEADTGRYQRNVGNYKSALEGLSGSFKAAGLSTKGFDQSLKLLNGNPIMLLLTGLVTVIRNISKAFKGNEEATMALKQAFSAFNPIIDATKRGLDSFANVIVNVVTKTVNGLTSAIGWLLEKTQQLGNFFGADWHMGDNFKEGVAAARELQQAENDYIKNKRAWQVESAKIDRDVADLREKATDKEKYNAKERLAFLDEAIALETKKAAKQKELAEENLRILQREAMRTENDAEMNDKLAEAERAVIEADKQLSDTKRNLSKQRQSAINEINSHTNATKENTKAIADNNAELEKQAEEYRKLTETEMQKAEDALNNIIEDAFEKRRAIEETNYKRQHDALLNAMVAEEEAHGTQTELYQAYMTQWEALETQHQQNMAAIKDDEAAKEAAINKSKVEDAKKTAEAIKRIEKSRLEYSAQIAGGLSDLMEAVAGENKAMVKASKIVALAEVAIKQGVAIAEAVASSAAGDPYTYALRVAAAIASTIAAMASAISSINSVKLARGTSYVQGPGTSTSDSIPAMLSKGEGVVNARANQMFPGVVGAMNDASVGIWSPLMSMLRSSGGAPAQVASPMQMTEIQMTNAFRNAVSDLDMYVSVEEINRGQRSVKVVENLGSM